MGSDANTDHPPCGQCSHSEDEPQEWGGLSVTLPPKNEGLGKDEGDLQKDNVFDESRWLRKAGALQLQQDSDGEDIFLK